MLWKEIEILVQRTAGNGGDVTLITRPRRFGKTLTMSMLDHFFSADYAGRGDLFENLERREISEPSGQLSRDLFKLCGCKGNLFSGHPEKICQIITDLYNKYDFLTDSGV